MHPRLQAFASQLKGVGRGSQRLYFAKVDVQACFDTIPQEKLLEVVQALMSQDEYKVEDFAVVKPMQNSAGGTGQASAKRVRYLSAGAPAGQIQSANNKTANQPYTVFVGSWKRKLWTKEQAMDLLREHVGGNIVRFGKRYFRQKNGIPQGSVVSSLLCSFFYAKLEQEVLPRFEASESLLVRLIDDFLLITTNKTHAEEFLRTMHRGVPEYGVGVKPEKSLANFSLAIDGLAVPRTTSALFPYCGLHIDTTALSLLQNSEAKTGSGK